jgi:hypothetical protein
VKKRLEIYLVLFVIVALAAGCSAIAKPYEANPIMREQSDLLQKDEDVVDVTKLKEKVAAAKTKAIRNDLIIELVAISDRVCSAHMSAIVANANAWNVGAGATTMVLSALGTVLGAETTKSALAAGATFTGGARSLVNEEVYEKSLGTTIIRAVSVAREKYYSDIQTGMKKGVDDYSVSNGLRDVQEYHRRCSFYYGLTEISKSLDQRKRTKKEIENEIAVLTTYSANAADKAQFNKKIDSLILEHVDAPN